MEVLGAADVGGSFAGDPAGAFEADSLEAGGAARVATSSFNSTGAFDSAVRSNSLVAVANPSCETSTR